MAYEKQYVQRGQEKSLVAYQFQSFPVSNQPVAKNISLLKDDRFKP